MFYPSMSHYCQDCTHNTTVPFNASVFSELHHCSRCGSPSVFNPSSPPSSSKTDAQNMQFSSDSEAQHLTDLFAHHMSLSGSAPTPPPDAQAPLSNPTDTSDGSKPIYPSAHYTHTRHVVPVRFNHTPSSSPRPQPLSDIEACTLLAEAHVLPASLSAQQLHLFRYAAPDQRQRLLQLWNIAPSSFASSSSSPFLPWQSQFPPPAAHHHHHQVGGDMASSSTAEWLGADTMRGKDDPIDRPASAPETGSVSGGGIKSSYAEPYMTNGYDLLAMREYEASMRDSGIPRCYNSATDPAWAATATAVQQSQPQDDEMVM